MKKCLCFAIMLTACSEGVANHPTGFDAGVIRDAASQDSASVDLSVVTDAITHPDADVHIDGLVINEIRAAGDDWVELYNPTSNGIALSDVRITDSNGAAVPDASHAASFPAGFVLEPGEYLVVVTDLGTATREGLQVDCLSGALARCVEASWGIGRTDGDTIHLIATDDVTLLSAAYPPNAVVDGQTWARLPNGTGDFAAGAPTPAAANAAPAL